ncbi:acyltransferase [Actinobacillus seminis]|nr:acyltransferase [Actinobacillus seminis]
MGISKILRNCNFSQKGHTYFIDINPLDEIDKIRVFIELIKRAESYIHELLQSRSQRKLTIQLVRLDNTIEIVNSIPGFDIQVLGTGNRVTVYEGTIFHHCRMVLRSNTEITIKKSKNNITRLKIWGNCARVIIGKDFSCWGIEIRCHEPQSEVQIGDDCMFSEEILIYPTDVHAIYNNETKELLNEAKPIIIGNHVWCGRRVSVLKGSNIADNSVIGMGSMVIGKFNSPNVIIAGSPAKIIKSNINWDRRNPFYWKYMKNVNSNIS